MQDNAPAREQATYDQSMIPKRLLISLKMASTIKNFVNNRFFTFILLLFVVVLAFGAGLQYGEKRVSTAGGFSLTTVMNRQTPAAIAKQADFSQFWQVWDLVSQQYYDKSAVDPQKMVNGAIQGMVSSLGDPYTTFLPPSANQVVKDDLGGNFQGVGMELGFKDNQLVVQSPLDNTPAQRAGILAGDYILKIDGQDATGYSLPQAVEKIRGPKGTHVTLELYRPGVDKPIDLDLVREEIHVKSVTFTQKPNNIGYIKLTQFGDDTNNEWDAAIDQALRSGVTSVIVDVRNNPGGYLESAIYVASEFINGPIVKQDDGQGRVQTFSSVRQGRLLTMPITVIINGGSASAAEIFSGAIMANNRGKLVGETSFGKGTIQQVEDLGNGAGIHITRAKWLMPNGVWVHKKGITPDYQASLTADDVKAARDPQLDKAIQVVQQLGSR